MSEANTEAIQAIYQRWSQGDFQTADVLDPHVVFVMRPEFPDAAASPPSFATSTCGPFAAPR